MDNNNNDSKSSLAKTQFHDLWTTILQESLFYIDLLICRYHLSFTKCQVHCKHCFIKAL